ARRLCVAPMMDWTDRHDRYFLRHFSRHALLYTEMVTTGALIHGDPARHLDHDAAEHPLALQLGGSDPLDLARSVQIAAAWGYDEINLNVGCPSDRVQSGRFGACLMAEPALVADCVTAMAESSAVPVTVKHRIGIDDQDDYDFLARFVETVAAAGCRVFIVHARKAILSGLSPKENRDIPPLRYPVVHRLKADFPELRIVINGGIRSIPAAQEHLETGLDGVMIGRAAYETPEILATVDRDVFNDPNAPVPDSHAIVRSLMPYADHLAATGQPLKRLTRHLTGLFHGRRGARLWRQRLSAVASDNAYGAPALAHALSAVPETAYPTNNPVQSVQEAV
ncbi:MAG: tRNA dihydrouridine(20/20a) synthase DusA, partial [Rhodospirillaceae bacterium]